MRQFAVLFLALLLPAAAPLSASRFPSDRAFKMPAPKKPIRIVHVAGSAQWAGGEVFLRQMADRLDRSQFDLRVVCPETGPLAWELRRRGIVRSEGRRG